MNKQQLAAKIWQSANQMRSKIEAKVNMKVDTLLQKFILQGGCDL